MAYCGTLKRALACAVGLSAFGAPGYAQDAWEGAYIGLHAGYVDSDLDWTLNGNGWWGIGNPASNRTSFSLDGETFGVHVGYNWVSPKNLLLGVDVSYNHADVDASQASPAFPTIDTWTVQINDFWDVSARVGKAYDKYMFYGSFGLAIADTDSTAIPPVDASSGDSMGFTVGVGGSYLLSQSVSVGLEYKFYDFGSEQHPFSAACGPCNVNDGRNIDLQSHVVNLKLTKHF